MEFVSWILLFGAALSALVIFVSRRLSFLQRFNQHQQSLLPLPPGPLQFPLVGNLPQAALHSTVPIYDYFAQLHKRYGKIFRFQAGVTAQVIVSDFDMIREISTNPSDVWIDRHTDEWLLERSYGKPLGILFSGGDLWRETRRFILRALRNVGFGKQRTQDEQIRKELAVLLQRIEANPSNEDGAKVLNMKHLFSVSVLNILWRMITGERFEEYDDPRLLELIAFAEVVSNNYSLAGDIYLAFPKLRHVLPYLTGHGSERRVFEPRMLQEFKNCLNRRRARESTGEAGDDFLVDAFLKKAHESKLPGPQTKNCPPDAYTDENFAVIVADLFLAGSETTSNSLEFAFRYMIQHPNVQARVQAEIDAVIGPKVPPEAQDLVRMPYTEATLLEIMRHATVVPFTARVPREDVELGGYRIPKGTMVVNNIYAVHYEAEFWGDPNKFRPERFLQPKDESICPSKKCRTIPFGIGRRQCLGETLARSTFFIYFVTFLQRYTFEAPAETPGAEKRVGLTVAPLPYKAVLKQREV